MNNKQEVIDFIKKDFNRIFKKNKNIDHVEHYHNLYGSYGAQSIHFLNKIDSFVLEIIVHSGFKTITISFNKMLELVYLEDKFELEGWVTFSLNADDIVENMIVSPHTDGFFISITDDNRQIIEDIVNEGLERDYGYSLDYYNMVIEREKDLPERGERESFDFENHTFDEFLQMFKDELNDDDLFKSNPIKPKRVEKVDLTNFHILETFT